MIFTPSCKIPLVGQPIGDPFGHDPYHSRLIHVKNGSGRAVSTHREKRSRSLLKKIAAPRQNPHYQRSKFLGQRSNRYLARCPSGPTTKWGTNVKSGTGVWYLPKREKYTANQDELLLTYYPRCRTSRSEYVQEEQRGSVVTVIPIKTERQNDRSGLHDVLGAIVLRDNLANAELKLLPTKPGFIGWPKRCW
jgi:hypothetical protein